MNTAAVALAVMFLLAAAGAAAATAFRPPTVRARSASTPHALAGISGGRIAVGIAVGALTLMATRRLLLALLAGALVVFWGRLLHDRRAAEER